MDRIYFNLAKFFGPSGRTPFRGHDDTDQCSEQKSRGGGGGVGQTHTKGVGRASLGIQGGQLNMAIFFWYFLKSATSKMSSVTRFVLSQIPIKGCGADLEKDL